MACIPWQKLLKLAKAFPESPDFAVGDGGQTYSCYKPVTLKMLKGGAWELLRPLHKKDKVLYLSYSLWVISPNLRMPLPVCFFSYFFETTRQGYKLLEGRLRCENSELCCAEGEILLAPFKGDDSAFLIKESRYVMKNNIAK